MLGVSINAADLESDRAGQPGKLVLAMYEDAGHRISEGSPAALIVDDFDATVGEWEQSTTTINHQQVLAQLMHLAEPEAAGAQLHERGGLDLDRRRRRAAGVPDAGEALHRRVRRDAHLDASDRYRAASRCARCRLVSLSAPRSGSAAAATASTSCRSTSSSPVAGAVPGACARSAATTAS